jgi:hypothetical protein
MVENGAAGVWGARGRRSMCFAYEDHGTRSFIPDLCTGSSRGRCSSPRGLENKSRLEAVTVQEVSLFGVNRE